MRFSNPEHVLTRKTRTITLIWLEYAGGDPPTINQHMLSGTPGQILKSPKIKLFQRSRKRLLKKVWLYQGKKILYFDANSDTILSSLRDLASGKVDGIKIYTATSDVGKEKYVFSESS